MVLDSFHNYDENPTVKHHFEFSSSNLLTLVQNDSIKRTP